MGIVDAVVVVPCALVVHSYPITEFSVIRVAGFCLNIGSGHSIAGAFASGSSETVNASSVVCLVVGCFNNVLWVVCATTCVDLLWVWCHLDALLKKC